MARRLAERGRNGERGRPARLLVFTLLTARLLVLDEQRRLLDPDVSTKLPPSVSALAAMDKRLVVGIVEAA